MGPTSSFGSKSITLILVCIGLALCSSYGQQPDTQQNSKDVKAAQKRGRFLLDRIRFALESNYYDQTFGGIDLATG